MRPIVFAVQREPMLAAFQQVSRLRPTILVRQPGDLDEAMLRAAQPEWVILPDWSWKVPEAVLALAPCVGFHAADLPAYRGGSPLQHQILDGLRETRLSMFRMRAGFDDGPILGQAPLDLGGTIGEIWARIVAAVPGMVAGLLRGDCRERPQAPGGFTRKRRTPAESRLPDLVAPIARLYDLMRALDDPYPNAFLLADGKRLSFRKPSFADGRLTAEVTIIEEPGHG